MSRRDFLRSSVRGRQRVLELSCERLHVQWVDARAAASREGAPTDRATRRPEWEGEPPLEVVVPTTEQLLAELERRLSKVQVLRIRGEEWLSGDGLRHEVASRIEAFRRRGGRVERGDA